MIKYIKKTAYFLTIPVFIGLVFLLGPKTPVDTEIRFKSSVIGNNPEAYLADKESKVLGIVPGLEKQIFWAKKGGEKTPLSLIYIHGFSASNKELHPLPNKIAEELGINVFYTRLKGHGRNNSASLAEVSVNDWINDYEEALAIGRSIGERVIVMGTSTGGSLVTWRAAQEPAPKDIAAYIFFSPNFGLKDKSSLLLTLPWGKQMVQLILGKEHTSKRKKTPLYLEGWTETYPSVALLPMAALAKLALNAPVKKVKTPALFIFSYKDKVVNPRLTLSIAKKWGGGMADMQILSQSDDPMMHVISGEALSPSTIPLLKDFIVTWLKNGPADLKTNDKDMTDQ